MSERHIDDLVETLRTTPGLPAPIPVATVASVGGEFLSAVPRVEASAERNIRFLSAREIAEMTPAEVRWVARPWVAEGALTEIEGKIKASGKTTLATHLCRAVLEGAPFLGEATQQSPIVFLSEQPFASFREALRRAGLLECDDLRVLSRFEVLGQPWPEIVSAAVDECLRVGARLLVTDTLHPFAGLSGDSENSAGAAQEAIEPLQQAAALHGLAVVINRHARKAGGEVGEAGRGSSAFGGAVDILISVRRRGATAPRTQRLLATLSRFDETPENLVIDLTADGYVALGSEEEAQRATARRLLLDVLPSSPDAALKTDEVFELEAFTEIGRTTVQTALAELVASGDVRKEGAGKRGDPFRYHHPPASAALRSADSVDDSFPPSLFPKVGGKK